MTTVDVRCPNCDGRGFTRSGPLEDGKGRAMYCDRCDGRGHFPFHVEEESVFIDACTREPIASRRA